MTFVLSTYSRDTIWMVADRCLVYPSRSVDDAVKVMTLQTPDAVAILGYAGLGATSRGTEPSEWMSAALRGRSDPTLEQALGSLAKAAQRELPKHLRNMPGGAHHILVQGFVEGTVGARFYSIDNAVDPKTGNHHYRYTRHVVPYPGSPAPRFCFGGSGGMYLYRKRDKSWQRKLLNLLKKHDSGKVSGRLVADQLAKLNFDVSSGIGDGSVGPRCIVVERRRLDPRRPGPGGGIGFCTGVSREPDAGPIPDIVNGLDVVAIANIAFPYAMAGDGPRGLEHFDEDKTSRLLRNMPTAPDERLR